MASFSGYADRPKQFCKFDSTLDRLTGMANKDWRRLFYIVQFIELPFKGIDDYVCVPFSWLITRSPSYEKTIERVIITYPNNEDPSDTRDRVKRKEEPNPKWRYYMASLKYETDDYKDAEYWIASKNDYVPGEEESEIKDTQQELMLDKKLRSASRSSWSSYILDKPQLTVEPNKNSIKPLPKIMIKRPLSQKPNKNLNNKHLKLCDGMAKKERKRLFYIVQFIELPFKGIDDYVCVPKSWLHEKIHNDRVVVTYPNNEDPSDTRDRVKRKEKRNDDWRFYIARLKYETDDYKDAEYWIASKNDYLPGEEESEIKDTHQELMLDKKLRSANRSSWSSSISDKPQLTVALNKNSRKPLPRISIKRPLSQQPNKNLNNKHLKLNENANSGAVTEHTIIESGCSKQEQSIITTDDKLVSQNDKTKISSAWNGKMNTEQSTQPGVMKENQSVKMAIESTSPKLTAEFQLSPQPTTHQKMSSRLLIDQQPTQKLIDKQHLSPKLLVEQQPSPIGPHYQQPLNISDVDLDDFDKDIERVSTRTPPNNLEQTPQPEPVNENSTPLVCDKHSLPEPHQRDGSAEQSKESNDSRNIHNYSILTAPRIELRPSSTLNQPSQHLKHLKLPILPVSSTLNSEHRSLEFVGKNSIEVANDHQTSRSKDCRDSTPSTSYHGSNWGMLFEPVAEKQSVAGKKLRNPVEKKTRLKGDSQNVTNMQYPLSSMMQFSLPSDPAVTQAAPSTQTLPVFQGIVNTSAEQNSNLAYLYPSFVQASCEQQYLATQADYLQQLACLQDMLKRQSVAETYDRRAHHQNGMMNEGFVVPNPIDQPVQFLPRYENQYIPVNSAYTQEVIRHDLMRRPTDGAHTTYKPNVQNGVNIQLDNRYSLSQFYQNCDHPQQKQYPPIYRDPWTSGTQNDLTLKSKHYSHMPKPQNITERPRSLSMSKSPSQALLEVQRSCLLQEQGIQGKMNPNCTNYSEMILAAVPENLTVEPAPTTQNAEVQTMKSSEIPHETQFTLIQRNHTYQLLHTNKSMVDKATETDFIMDADHCIDKIAGSSVGKVHNCDNSQQKQYPPIYRDPWTSGTQNDLTLKSKHYSHMPKPQNITERPRSLCMSKSPSQALLELQRSCLLQEQGIQGKMNPNYTNYSEMILAAIPENLTVEAAPTTQNAEVQTMTSSEISHETQFSLIQRNHTHQLLHTNKSMVDKATETDFIMDADHCIDKIAGSSVGKSTSKLGHSASQTDEPLIEEQGSPYHITASDSETAAEQEIESENELDSEVHEKNRTNVRNVSPEDQKLQAEQDMLNAAGTFFTRMGTYLSITRDIFNFSRNSILVCAQDYKTLLEKVDKLNAVRSHEIHTSSSNNVTSEVLKVTQERPAGDNDNTTGVGDTVAPISNQRGKFSLPVEYDPNDTKWTLKYQENKPGLVELIPRTGVYVSKKVLKRCIGRSNDCRTLARLLLTEIFSQNALSVCSLTGGKAKAFNSVNIDVRPGLDEHARLVLLAFVEKHGNKQGWVTSDTPAVMSSIRAKINKMRAKHGK